MSRTDFVVDLTSTPPFPAYQPAVDQWRQLLADAANATLTLITDDGITRMDPTPEDVATAMLAWFHADPVWTWDRLAAVLAVATVWATEALDG
jgi:hypothetical protein